MSVPKYQKFYVPFLKEIADQEVHQLSEIRKAIASRMNLTEEDLNELTPGRKQNVFIKRVGWAATYLKKAGLIESPKKAHYQITSYGLNFIKKHPQEITNEMLMESKSFQEFTSKKSPDKSDSNHVDLSEDTPQEIITREVEKINEDLADELLLKILDQSPYFFEKIVMDLLQNMGYGGTSVDDLIVTQKSNDGGIDGIVKEDKLGFNSIYVQAKRWDTERTITKPELQKFVGALSGADKGSAKGLFITTASFSEGAKVYAKNQHTAKVVLVDGKALANLMIKYDLGVSIDYSYEIKSMDADYFNDNDAL